MSSNEPAEALRPADKVVATAAQAVADIPSGASLALAIAGAPHECHAAACAGRMIE